MAIHRFARLWRDVIHLSLRLLMALAGFGHPGAGSCEVIPLKLPLSVQPARIVDATGTEVVLQGVNVSGMEWGAGTPWWQTCNDPQWGSKYGCYAIPSPGVYDNLAAWGFNLVRIPIAWSNIEPANGQGYNGAYLHSLDQIVEQFGKRHIAVIFSMHQWAWSPVIDATNPYTGKTVHGNGWPVWLYPDQWFSVNPVTQQPRKRTLSHGLDGQTAAAAEFFANQRLVDGQPIQDRLIAVWTMLAQRYAAYPNVVGADMMNEPYDDAPGQLEDFYARVGIAIHHVNPAWLLIFEPSLSARSVDGARILAAPGFPKNKAVYSFHMYAGTWNQPGLNAQGQPKLVGLDIVRAQIAHAASWSLPLWLGEFHLIMSDHMVDPDQSRPMMDFMWQDGSAGNGVLNVSWTYWAYQRDSQALNGADDSGPINYDLVNALRAGLIAPVNATPPILALPQ